VSALAPTSMPSRRLRVLIVDDEKEIAEEIAEFLTLRKVDAVAVDRCATALAVLDEDRDISVLVTDIRMPDMNGIEMLSRIYAPGGIGTETALKSIVLTGHATADDLFAATKAGAFATLIKPCSLRVLHDAIAAAAKAAGWQQDARRP
jgi:DNA-binding NtrC family response regulator